MSTLIYQLGDITIATFNTLITSNLSDEDRKKVVFIFPGNTGHHTGSSSLYSPKSGDGLAAVAKELGDIGYATLSLPTTGISSPPNKTSQNIVRNALCDLYRAAGAGYSFVLPVREHIMNLGQNANPNYFENPLQIQLNNKEIQPKFWGGEETIPNKALATQYIDQLNAFSAFLANSAADKQSKLEADFLAAYQQGLANRDKPTDSWFMKKPQPGASITATHETDSTPAIRRKDHLLFFKGKDELLFNHAIVLRQEIKMDNTASVSLDNPTHPFEQKNLKNDQVYRARRLFEPGIPNSIKRREALLVQDNTGKVEDLSQNLTKDEKQITALAMARMFLQSHQLSESVILNGRDLEMAGMVHAALLKLDPTIQVINEVLNPSQCPDPQKTDAVAKFIKHYLPENDKTIECAVKTYKDTINAFKKPQTENNAGPAAAR